MSTNRRIVNYLDASMLWAICFMHVELDNLDRAGKSEGSHLNEMKFYSVCGNWQYMEFQ